MDEHDPLDETLSEALRSDDTIDATSAFASIVGRGRRRRAQRRVAFGATVIAAVLTVAGIAFAATNLGTSRVRVAGTTVPTSPTSTPTDRTTRATAKATTTTTAPPTSTTKSPIPAGTTPVAPPGTNVPPPTQSVPTTTNTAPSPWPPGTYLKPDHLTSVVTFDPPEATFGQTIDVTATITNPDNNWVFANLSADEPGTACSPPPAADCTSEASDLGIDIGEDSYIPYVLVRGTSPTLHHQTAQGEFDGLLLPPHGTYQMTGTVQINAAIGIPVGPTNGPWTLDTYVILHDNIGVGQNSYGFGSSTGSLTLLPNPSVTTPTTSPPT